MGKWSKLKDMLPKFEIPNADYREKVDKTKANFQEQMLKAGGKKALLEGYGSSYAELRQEKEDIERQLSDVDLGLEAINQLMTEEMEARGIDSFRIAGGPAFSVMDEPYPKIADKLVFNEWIKETGQEELFSVHAQTAKALVKARLEEGESMPPGVECFMKTVVRMRK